MGPDNPVLEHYRAYRAAIEAGDLARAETAAAAALAQSTARDGDGGRTGILALNLAQVRLDRGLGSGAVEPARQALEIASRDAASGVDPLLAKLTLGQAELSTSAGAERLEAALSESANRADLADATYASLMALGEWRVQRERFAEAQASFAAARAAARANSVDPTYAAGRALTREGVAIVRAVSRGQAFADAALNSRRGADLAAHAAFTEAAQSLAPLALRQSAEGGLTLAESTYSEALAWREALRARMRLEGDRPPPLGDQSRIDRGADACAVRVRPAAFMPPSRQAPGAVVFRLKLNDAGVIVEQRVAAAVPTNLARAAVEWQVERSPGAASNCRMAGAVFVPVSVEGS
ncbi:MAG: hypothetical protein JNJ73_09915 [Hyphomonadaceae bacterium]|nr:hypothetical protein [Hyphomonadaceae bacterium]